MKNLINNMVMGKSIAGLQNPNMRTLDPQAETMNGAMGNIEGIWNNSKNIFISKEVLKVL